MNATNVTIKERGLALKTYAQHSAQHCELAILLAEMASAPIDSEKLEALKHSFREIRVNSDLLYKKRIRSLAEQAVTDFVMIRNITANFNKCTIELINLLSKAIADGGYEKVQVFYLHMISEEKEMLEHTYAISFP